MSNVNSLTGMYVIFSEDMRFTRLYKLNIVCQGFTQIPI